jgi:LmbE family N-acetylglucosaminyl deacetylase
MVNRTSERIDREHAFTGEKLGLMVVLAHPEEETFGPAGMLARYASEGVHVSMITVTRQTFPSVSLSRNHEGAGHGELAREKSCSCLTHGTQRICLFDYPGMQIPLDDRELMEERLIRLIREQHPQVIVTYSPDETGDPDHALISRVATAAFHLAGDPSVHPQHIADSLGAFQPLKLYYTLHPPAPSGRKRNAPATAVLDISDYSKTMERTLYCQRTHAVDFALGQDSNGPDWNKEYFTLAACNLSRRPRRETDLFAGLR